MLRREVLSGVSVEWVKETGLAGNIWKEDISRLQFQYAEGWETNEIPLLEKTDEPVDPAWEFQIAPMEIKTFIVKLN